MKSDVETKAFDCVQWTRETRDRINERLAGMSPQAARKWLNEAAEQDPLFSRIPKSPVLRPARHETE